MSYLVQFSIGPVQSFIEASRKTRDLAAGSALLVKLSQQVVDEANKVGAKFIFPADAQAAAANVVLVEMADEPTNLAASVKDRVRRFLISEFENAAKGLDGLVRPDVAKAQLERFPEVYSAWVKQTGDYRSDRKRLGTLMAARKSTRDFEAYPVQLHQPKSPLAPQFDGVLKTGDGWTVDSRACERLLLKPREHLDAISLVKRRCSMEGVGLSKADNERFAVKGFPSTRLIAVLDLLQCEPEACEELKGAIAPFEDLDLGDAMFPLEDPEQERAVSELRKKLCSGGKPRPYYAVIHADGDHMGRLLESKNSASDHNTISRQLNSFAQRVPEIVRKNHGVPVYSGGDDVLAFSTAFHAVDIAQELAEAFRQHVEGGATLTVGVAICHVTDDLQSCVDFARSLERMGKTQVEGKNALAVGVRVRSGSETRFAESWERNPQSLLAEIIALFQEKKLTRGFPYELRELARELTGMRVEGMDDLIRNEVGRIYRRKNPKVKPNEELSLPDWVTDPEGLRRYANLLAIAHFMTRGGNA